MSYDLMVFQPEAAPTDHQEFLDWYFDQVDWDEGHSYDDPTVTTPALRNWYLEIIQQFPALNGPHAQQSLPDDEATASDYSIGKEAVYVCFAWSKAENTYQTVIRLAAKYKIGFFDVSSMSEEVWLPSGDGLKLAHQKIPPTALQKLKRIFLR